MGLKKIIRKLLFKEKSSSATYIAYLRNLGMKIGEDCKIYVPSKTLIDEQYPWLISIGSHVRIAQGVIILVHDYSWSVLKRLPDRGSDADIHEGGIFGASGPVTIGDNVFIGMNAIITRHVNIGNNVIIGAGSVVTKDCEANSVYAGSPAQKIMSIDDYYKKRENAQLEEAKDLALRYYKRYGKRPAPDIFHEYFMLFETADSFSKEKVFKEKMELCGNFQASQAYLKEHQPFFSGYEEFMRYCFHDDK